MLSTHLEKYFNFKAFRPGQEEIVQAIIAGQDVIALMPTGGGKSLCYQLPALAEQKITLVISPLIALMKDQVDNLKARGLNAVLINSSLNLEEVKQAVKEIENKKILQSFTNKKLEVLKQNLNEVEQNNSEEQNNQKIVLSDAEKIYLVSVDEIVRCESNGNYTSFYLTENRTITISQSIKVFEQMLPTSIFYRVHRSHLMNLDFFEFLDKKDGGTIHLKDGSTLPIAIRRKDDLLEKLRNR